MAAPLLTTKLYIPPVRPELVSRPRLIERLNEGLHRRLTLISAPAGFGKTTLIAEWLQHLRTAPVQRQADGAGRRIAWLSLDDEDNDPVRFFAYLIAALETVQPDLGADARPLLQSPRSPPLKSVLTLLINSLATLPKDQWAGNGFVLVLDDYHVIEEQSIHDALTFLLEHLPPQMHLVIASRVDPPLPLARLRTRSQLAELRAADLRFAPDEVATFLNQVMGLGLGADHIAALETRTEGWIAGLQLAALSMQGRADIPAFIAAFTGSQHYVLDYLVEEVLQRQPEGVQTFLLQTSILDRMAAPLCDALTGADDSQAMLDRLEHANLFVVPLDDNRRWYRYHHLFADFLRARLHQTQPGQVPELHRRASEWYEHRAASLGDGGLMAAAIDHALSAGDFKRAAHLIEGVADATLMRSEVATFLSWVEALPDEVLRTQPLLCVYQAWFQILGGHPLDAVEARLQGAIEADTSDSISGEVTVFRALITAYQGDTRQSAELCDRALAILPEERLFLRSVVAGVLGLNYLYSGDLAAARRALDEATRVGQQAGNLMITVLALCHLAELSLIQGQPYEARAFYRQALAAAVDGQGQPRPIAGMALMGIGSLLREWNDLEAAARHFIEGIELTTKWGEVGAINGYTGLARVRQAQGDVEGAREAIKKAQQLAIKFDAMEMDDILVGVVQVQLWVAQGDIEAAWRWVEERGLDRDASLDELEKEAASASLPFHRALEFIALAWASIARGRPEKALQVLKPMLRVAETAGWTALVIQVLILEALAFQRQEDTPRALTALERALSLAEPGGFLRTFVDEGKPMADLLHQAAARDIAPGYTSRLLAAFEAQMQRSGGAEDSPSPPPPSPPYSPVLVEPLSERELEVLRLIVSGMSNREIAEELFVAISTVKTHINNIYRKLDVSRRTQATARARELDLL